MVPQVRVRSLDANLGLAGLDQIPIP